LQNRCCFGIHVRVCIAAAPDVDIEQAIGAKGNRTTAIMDIDILPMPKGRGF